MGSTRAQHNDSELEEEIGEDTAQNGTEDATPESNSLFKVFNPLTMPLASAQFLFNQLTETTTFDPLHTWSNKIARFILGSLAAIASLCVSIALLPASLLMGLYWEDDPVTAGTSVLVTSTLVGIFVSPATLIPTIPVLSFIWWQQIHALMGGPLLGFLGVTSPVVSILFPLVFFVFRVIVPAMQKSNSENTVPPAGPSTQRAPRRAVPLEENKHSRRFAPQPTPDAPAADCEINPLRIDTVGNYFYENKPGRIVKEGERHYFQFKDNSPSIMLNTKIIDNCNTHASRSTGEGLGLASTASVGARLSATSHGSRNTESKRGGALPADATGSHTPASDSARALSQQSALRSSSQPSHEAKKTKSTPSASTTLRKREKTD